MRPLGLVELARIARAEPLLERCEALTVAQRMRRATVWVLVGALIAAACAALYVRHSFEPELQVLEPKRYVSDTLTVWRFRFGHVGGESSCYAVLYRDLQTWTVECP